MASVARNYQKTNSFASQDWDLLSSDSEDSNLPMIQERLSVASLSSEESDTVVIFGGNKGNRNPSLARTPSSRDSVLYKNENIDAWELQHQQLLSSLSKDPILQQVTAGSNEAVEKHLFAQISQLEEKLEEAQNESHLLLQKNESLLSDNTLLKQKVERILKFYSTKHMLTNNELEKAKSAADLRRAGLLLAVGAGVILVVKKRIVISNLGVWGTMLLAGSLGVYNCLLNEKDDKVAIRQE